MPRFGSFATDVRLTVRILLRDRAFTLTALAILALGIGANTAVFSVVDSVVLRPLAYSHSERLYTIWEVVPQVSHLYPTLPVNARHYLEWTRNARSFEQIALMDRREFNLTGSGDPEKLEGARVTANLFPMLGVPARFGRTFMPEDAQAGHDQVVLITDPLWRRRFGADPSIVGRSILLNSKAYTVVGILPPTFRTPIGKAMGLRISDHVQVFQPWAINEKDWDLLGEHNYAALGRLAVGVSAQQATAELNVLQSNIAARLTGQEKIDLRAQLEPLHQHIVGRVRSGLLLLLGAVGAVLVITCLNLGNLTLVRATARTREMAIRTALGAPRWRIFRGVLMESLILAVSGALAGIALAFSLVNLFVVAAPVDLPRLEEVAIDWRVLSFALLVSAASGIVFGLGPAWRLTRSDPQESLRSGSRSATDSGGRMKIRELLVGLEVAISVALLIVAGLLTVSFANVAGVTRGYDAQNVLTAEVTLTGTRYDDGQKRLQFFRELTGSLSTRPGVLAAGMISVLPLKGEEWTDVVSVEGDQRPLLERPLAQYRPVSPGYFQSMGIPVRAGRPLAESDHPRKVALVTERVARKLWPNEDAIGKRFRRGDPEQPALEVIGVVGDIRGTSLQEEPQPMVYVPYWERIPRHASIAVRTSADPRSAEGSLTEAVHALDPQIPISGIQTMQQIESGSLAQRRFQVMLIVAFAACALLLAAVGMYGVLAYSVARRTNELGLRMALGARREDVLSMVLRQAVTPVLLGTGGGILCALALGRVISGLLFSVSASDPETIAVVIAVTLAAATAAAWIPARRAIRVDPLIALRHE